MLYKNLHELINESSSSRQFLLSLPVDIQIKLHDRNDHIRSLYELHTNAHHIIKNSHLQ